MEPLSNEKALKLDVSEEDVLLLVIAVGQMHKDLCDRTSDSNHWKRWPVITKNCAGLEARFVELLGGIALQAEKLVPAKGTPDRIRLILDQINVQNEPKE